MWMFPRFITAITGIPPACSASEMCRRKNLRLVRVAKECMEKGIEQVKPWRFLGDMADAVNRHAKANGYSVVIDIGGHGVGLEFHEDPFVSYVAPAGTETLMVPGMIFTIEPMINMGTPEIYVDDSKRMDHLYGGRKALRAVGNHGSRHGGRL